MTHFTDLTPEDIGILDDAAFKLLNPDKMSTKVAQRVFHLWHEGYLAGIEITEQGKEILRSLEEFRESLKD